MKTILMCAALVISTMACGGEESDTTDVAAQIAATEDAIEESADGTTDNANPECLNPPCGAPPSVGGR